MRRLIRCFAAVALLAGAVPVHAQLPIVRGRFWQNKSIQDKLKLTPEQIDRIEAIFWQSREKLVSLDHRVQSSQVRLERLLSEAPVPAGADAAMEEYANSKADLEKATIGMLLRMWRELTPAQWRQLRAIGLSQRERAAEQGFASGGTPPRPHTPELDRPKP
jgi:Spy/CpxP family protein refolding chaperone